MADAELDSQIAADAPATAETTGATLTTEESKAAEQEPDWKVIAAQEKAARAKLENDLRALKGLRTTETQRDAVLQDISDRLLATERMNTALLKALSEGTPETLGPESERIRQESTQSAAQRAFNAHYTSLKEDLFTAVNDEDGQPILNIETAKELEPVRQLWMETVNDQRQGATEKLANFAKAVGLAHRIMRAEERNRSRAEGEKLKKVVATKRQEDLDLDIGPSGPVGNVTEDNLDVLWLEAERKGGKNPYDDRYRQMLERLAR